MFIYFSFEWYIFQLHEAIITNLNMQKKKGLQALMTTFKCISYGNRRGCIEAMEMWLLEAKF
jgi:hypothetical protein